MVTMFGDVVARQRLLQPLRSVSKVHLPSGEATLAAWYLLGTNTRIHMDGRKGEKYKMDRFTFDTTKP